MTARFRAENRLTPRLETQYIASTRPPADVLHYRPGLRQILPYREHTTEVFTLRIQTEYGEYVHQIVAIPGTSTSEPWETLKTKVFELYGNDPVIYGTLQSLVDIQTGTIYTFGKPLPARSSTFRPVVSFTQ